ncbi:MAG: prepilin-type N-terminal cleavage/methylation domain-containing protein [Fimbriimonadaceae bacterium]|nr:prepilin-type N-terminal cleavage/methylation domain-containing protein [Fimbriimonadaceae bacterium]
MRKAFTLIELLVVIAIIAILAAILFPVFAQAKESAKAASDLSNVKQLATAVAMYDADYDDLMPLGHGINPATGQIGYNYGKYVPADWASTPTPPERVDYSRTFVMNTIQPYVKNDAIMAAPSQSVYVYQPTVPVAAGKIKGTTTYAYNGFLHGWSATAVASPSNLPLFTAANGNRVGLGTGFANPALACPTAGQPCVYTPRGSTGCSTANGGNGATGGFYLTFEYPASSYWLYKGGQNWSMTDTHAKFRRVGATIAPGATDYRTDPWTNYTATGSANSYWWNLCHAWLFRPDYDFS